MKPAVPLVAFTTVTFLLGSTPVLALDPSLDVSQYAHTASTLRDGFAQTQHQSRLFRVDPGVDPTEVTFVGFFGRNRCYRFCPVRAGVRCPNILDARHK